MTPSFAILRPSGEEAQRVHLRELVHVSTSEGEAELQARWHPSSHLVPSAAALALRSGLPGSPEKQPEELCPGNGESTESTLFARLLQLQCRGSVSKAWVSELPLWQRSATCRAADHLCRRELSVCVCARGGGRRAACLAVWALLWPPCVSESCLGQRRSG